MKNASMSAVAENLKASGIINGKSNHLFEQDLVKDKRRKFDLSV